MTEEIRSAMGKAAVAAATAVDYEAQVLSNFRSKR